MSVRLAEDIRTAPMSYLTCLKALLLARGSRNYNPQYPIQVLKANGLYYIGQADERGLPYSRLSEEYWGNSKTAEKNLHSGNFTLRFHP